MSDITPGQAFYNRQIAFIEAQDIDGLMTQYADDAVMVGFDFQFKGLAAIRQRQTDYLAGLGYLKLKSTDKWAETPDSIFFEATITTAGGEAKVYDVFILHDGKATHHFTGLLSFTPNS